MTTYRLWPSTNGPATPISYTGPFIAGTAFCLTGEGWFEGYWWWVCPTGQATTGVKCALWQLDQNDNPHLVSGSVVTAGTLTAGQWNFIPVATPLQLSWGGSPGMTPSLPCGEGSAAIYIAAVGFSNNFPDTNNYWGASQPGASGIQNGPLLAFSDSSASLPSPKYYSGVSSMPQGVFTTAGSDPSVNCPQGRSGTDNFWVDVQIGSYAEVSGSNPSLRLWPNFPESAITVNNDTSTAVSATAFTLSTTVKLTKIWFYSPSGAAGFPSRVGIWNTSTQTEVSGTDNSSPSWQQNGSAATAGTGWVYVAYSGVTLPAGNYSVAFYNGNAQKIYYDASNYFFAGTDPVGGATVGGPGFNGLSAGGGILTAPNVAHGPSLVYDDSSGTKAGQTAYSTGNGAWRYPGNFEASSDWGETRWIDVEVTPEPTASATRSITATITAAATASLSTGATRNVTATITAHAAVTRHRTASRSITATITATATVTRHRSVSRPITATITAGGTNSGNTSPAGARPMFIATIGTTGTADRHRGTTRSVTATITAAAKVIRHRSGPRPITVTITASAVTPGGNRSASLSVRAAITARASVQHAGKGGSWWQLRDVLVEQAAYADYYRSQPPVACPNDGEPLTPGPGNEPVTWFCKFDGWSYPDDYDPDIHAGM